MTDWEGLTESVLGLVTTTFNRGPFTVRPVSGSPASYAVASAILDRPHVEQSNNDAEVGVSSTLPSLFVRLSDLTTVPAELDEWEQDSSGLRWRVIDVQPDGEGGADLVLEEVG